MNRPPADDGYQKARDLYHQGRRQQAESQLRRFLQRSPRHAGANNLMAILLIGQGRLDRALHHAEIATREDPRQVAYLNTHGVVLTHLKRHDVAAAILRRAIEIFPAYTPAHLALGIALAETADIPGAEASFRKAIDIQPRDPQPRTNLAKLLLDSGRIPESIAELERALELAPDHRQVLSDLAGALNYIDIDPDYTLSIHKRLGAAIEAAAGEPFVHAPRAERSNRCRLGYLSADFRAHSVASFIEPLLAAHERSRFEVVCYHASPEHDAITRRIRSLAHHWRDVATLDDQHLAERIRQDRLDVLIDLGGHTSGSRVACLARCPAPVQLTWCGYANTTGMSRIDGRIVDELTDPAPVADALATEKLLRIPGCFLCYRPPAEAPPVAPLPAREAGHVTFGSFNMLPKIGEASITLWAAALRAVPGSRMIIKAKGIDLPGVRERLLDRFADQGVEAGRIELLDFMPALAGHLALYGRVDIALDTYPYHGTTTTCEALWMGVPVITRVGSVHASRVGLSLLNSLDLTAFAVADAIPAGQLAAQLASDLDRLAELRASLRARMQDSPLCDAAAFARRFEALLLEVVPC